MVVGPSGGRSKWWDEERIVKGLKKKKSIISVKGYQKLELLDYFGG